MENIKDVQTLDITGIFKSYTESKNGIFTPKTKKAERQGRIQNFELFTSNENNKKTVEELYRELVLEGKNKLKISQSEFFRYFKNADLTSTNNIDKEKLRTDIISETDEFKSWLKDKNFKAIYDKAKEQRRDKVFVTNCMAHYNVSGKNGIELISDFKKISKSNSNIASILSFDIVNYFNKNVDDKFKGCVSELSSSNLDLVMDEFVKSAFKNLNVYREGYAASKAAAALHENAEDILAIQKYEAKNYIDGVPDDFWNNEKIALFLLVDNQALIRTFAGSAWYINENERFVNMLKNISDEKQVKIINDDLSQYSYSTSKDGSIKQKNRGDAKREPGEAELYFQYLYQSRYNEKPPRSFGMVLGRAFDQSNRILKAVSNNKVFGFIQAQAVIKGVKDITVNCDGVFNVLDNFQKEQKKQIIEKLLKRVSNKDANVIYKGAGGKLGLIKKLEEYSKKYGCVIPEGCKEELAKIKNKLETEKKINETIERLKPTSSEKFYNVTLPELSTLRRECIENKNIEMFNAVYKVIKQNIKDWNDIFRKKDDQIDDREHKDAIYIIEQIGNISEVNNDKTEKDKNVILNKNKSVNKIVGEGASNSKGKSKKFRSNSLSNSPLNRSNTDNTGKQKIIEFNK